MAHPAHRHTPVKLDRCLDLLAPALDGPNAVLVDATVGMGGHSEGALERFPNLTVIGIDRDPHALDLATARLSRFGDRFRPYHGTYDEIPEALAGTLADGILMDLGVSSMQLDEVDRGFSYSRPAPLDMRMDPTQGLSAQELLSSIDRADLVRMLRRYGDEKFAPRVATGIITAREQGKLRSTADLAQVVRDAIPAAARRTGGNPAKRTFQAIRIAVNDELGILERAVPLALESLRVGGRIVVESYQSLEDRVVKEIFAEGANPHVPPGLPVTATQMDARRKLRLLTRGAERASEEEARLNARSIPVRLRAAELLVPWSDDVR